MKKLISISLVVALALLLTSPVCFGAVGVRQGASHRNIGTATDIDVGNSGYFDGNTLYLSYETSVSGVSTMVSGSTTIPVAYTTVHKVIGSTSTGTLADGKVGQIMYIDISSDTGGYTWTVTPTTKTNFTSIAFTGASSFAVLMFTDPTVGWIIIDSGNVTIS
jgi:hypothetical protein